MPSKLCAAGKKFKVSLSNRRREREGEDKRQQRRHEKREQSREQLRQHKRLKKRVKRRGGRRRLSVSSSKSPFGIIDDLANLINLITAGSIARQV